MMTELGWAMNLTGVKPAVKLAAMFIADEHGTGDGDHSRGVTFNIVTLARFCCVPVHEIDGILDQIPCFAFKKINSKKRVGWIVWTLPPDQRRQSMLDARTGAGGMRGQA